VPAGSGPAAMAAVAARYPVFELIAAGESADAGGG
jgi:hypothetical protein